MIHFCRIWFSALRPRTLSASVAPVAMGTAIAYGDGLFHAGGAVATLIGALGIQIACNFANDFFDARQGADTAERMGPVRAVAAGLVSARAMLCATIAVIIILVLPCVVYLVYRGGWPFAVLGAVSVILAFAYTGSRWSLAYLGLGDVFAFFFFGPIAVAGTYAAQAIAWSWIPAIAGCGVGLLACALISVNNLRDEPTDRLAQKRTLAVRFGPAWARMEFITCILGAGLIAIAFAAWSGRWWCASAAIASCALLPSILRVIRGESGRPLNRELAATGQATLGYGILFSIGWNL